MKVVVFGAGRVGTSLVRFLEGKKSMDITVVDSEKKVCDILASDSNVQVICGDATDPALLDDLKLGKCDFVFAVTGSEEVNFLTSVYAKQADSKKVISRASEPKYSKLMEKLGIEPLIPEYTLARELANMVISPAISKLLDPGYSHVDLLEYDVGSDLADISVPDAEKKKKFIIVSIYENGEFLAPGPGLVLKKGMKIVVLKYNQSPL